MDNFRTIEDIIDQLTPAVEDGKVRLYGIDPKGQLKSYQGSKLFQRLATDRHVGAMGVIAEVHGLMLDAVAETTFETDKTGSRDAPSPKAILVIEDYLSLFRGLQETIEAGRRATDELSSRSSAIAPIHLEAIIAVGETAKDVANELEEIMVKGRAAGVFVIATTRNTDKDLLSRARNNFTRHIIIEPEEEPDPFEEFFLAEARNDPDDGGVYYTMDPMETPLQSYEASPLFEKIEAEDIIQHRKIIDAIYERMKKRSGN